MGLPTPRGNPSYSLRLRVRLVSRLPLLASLPWRMQTPTTMAIKMPHLPVPTSRVAFEGEPQTRRSRCARQRCSRGGLRAPLA